MFLEMTSCTCVGARITALDGHNHGIVETCAMSENLDMLHYFIELEDTKLPVWKKLIKFLSASTDKEAEKVGSEIFSEIQ